MTQVLDEAADVGLPVWITENGTSYQDDASRIAALDDDLSAVQAVAKKDDVRGYFYWTWVDNYEWNHGMSMKFGLYALDPTTKARTSRPLMDHYRTIIQANQLE